MYTGKIIKLGNFYCSMKSEVLNILRKALKELNVDFSEEEISKILEVPPSHEMGDFAFPCFVIAKKLKDNPYDLAVLLRGKIGKPNMHFSDIQVKGPYVNFFVNRLVLAESVIKKILNEKKNFGVEKVSKKENIMIEFPSPNTNKPLHLGHLLNMSIGESVSRILESRGNKVIRANLNNDRGIHICKSMLAYQKWGKEKKPSKGLKSDHLVGDFYVMFSKKAKKNANLEREAHEMLRKWEAGDKSIRELWKIMNKWALDGFKKTYETFGIKHNKEYFEHLLYDKGKDLVTRGVDMGIFEKNEDGSVKIDLKKKKLGEKYLLRADGTTLYMTQDLYLAQKKFEECKLDQSIYVVANEQNYHFDVLFYILELLGFKQKLKHLSYGMVNLPEGRMKSREGTVVDADDLIEEIKNLARKELLKRGKLSKKELERRSLIISLAAIKYMLLKIDIKRNRVFNPKQSIAFEGDTGPYLLYSYARASSIFRKSGLGVKKGFKLNSTLEDKEVELVKKLKEWSIVVDRAYREMNPSLIANYAYALAQNFNEFYHTCPVMNSEKQDFRLALVESFRIVLETSLGLLGIDVLEEM